MANPSHQLPRSVSETAAVFRASFPRLPGSVALVIVATVAARPPVLPTAIARPRKRCISVQRQFQKRGKISPQNWHVFRSRNNIFRPGSAGFFCCCIAVSHQPESRRHCAIRRGMHLRVCALPPPWAAPSTQHHCPAPRGHINWLLGSVRTMTCSCAHQGKQLRGVRLLDMSRSKISPTGRAPARPPAS